MALQAWDKNYREQLKIQEQEIESLQEQLMISGATGQGGSPGQLYKPPVTNPGRGEAVFGTEKGGQRYFEFLKAMQINPNSIMLPFVPKDAETDEDYGEGDVPGHPDWKLSHGEHFDEYGQPIQDPTRGMDPSGNPITIPHLQQTPEEHERNKQLHMDKYHQAMNYPPATERDKWLQLYQGPGGTLRHIQDPDMRKLILQRGAMKAEAPKNDLQIAGLNLGGGRFLYNYEIKMLRDAFQGASEKERNRLIEMYSDKPFKGLV